MADAVTSKDIFLSRNKLVRRITGVSDGTGEVTVVKVDKSALVGPEGIEPRRLVVRRLEWAVEGYDGLQLLYDHGTDNLIDILVRAGMRDYGDEGGLSDTELDGTGDIVLTSIGATSGGVYDILLEVELRGG